jgi:hypothetical protein
LGGRGGFKFEKEFEDGNFRKLNIFQENEQLVGDVK